MNICFFNNNRKFSFWGIPVYMLGLYACCWPVFGESFRVHKTAAVAVTLENPATSTMMGVSDALAISIPKDRTFIQGIEIDMKIPPIVAEWRDSVAWTLFNKITPAPDETKIDYSGTHLILGTLPSRLSWTVDIPLVKNYSLKDSPYVSKLDILPDTSDGYLFLRLQQAMKGTPEEFSDAKFDIAIKLLLVDQGKLVLNLSGPDKPLKPYSVFVDQQPFTPQLTGNMIDPGVHTVSVVSDFYRNEIRTVRIEQAKISTLPVMLRGLEPTLRITAPENITVYLDDTQTGSRDIPFIVTEGEHKVRFVIGDYEVIKNFTVKKGRSYTAALSINATITEEE